MIREVPREDSTALYITKIRRSPEAELEKKLCSQHASQCRNSKETKKTGEKIAEGTRQK